MRKVIVTIAVMLALCIPGQADAQEKFGKTLNLGVGFGFGSHLAGPVPSFHLNYEFDVAKNFTLAPFVGFYTYSRTWWWGGNKNYPARTYTYYNTVIPVGVKGTYYFDELLKANDKWDFYAAASLGFAFQNSRYDDIYYGDDPGYGATPLFVGLHIGAEYHFSKRLGVYLDLSNTFSTVGLAIHP